MDWVVRACPIDERRHLYRNIVLSGGSTSFKDFGRRLQQDVRRIVDARLASVQSQTGHRSEPLEVEVVSFWRPQEAVWFGGSMLASTPEFYEICPTKAYYEEHGPAGFRNVPAFEIR